MDVNISYDLLFDILRYEKSREELQTIDMNFYADVSQYLKDKESSMLNSQTPVSERELIRIQLNNVKKLLIELYERREKKIINLALYKLKTGTQSTNISALLPEELPMFESIYEVFSTYKDRIINAVLEDRPAYVVEQKKSVSPPSIVTPKVDTKKVLPLEMNGIKKEEKEYGSAKKEDDILPIRFVRPVPRFLGPELETYGPFEQDEIASLPAIIAKILISKERAEEIKIE